MTPPSSQVAGLAAQEKFSRGPVSSGRPSLAPPGAAQRPRCCHGASGLPSLTATGAVSRPTRRVGPVRGPTGLSSLTKWPASRWRRRGRWRRPGGEGAWRTAGVRSASEVGEPTPCRHRPGSRCGHRRRRRPSADGDRAPRVPGVAMASTIPAHASASCAGSASRTSTSSSRVRRQARWGHARWRRRSAVRRGRPAGRAARPRLPRGRRARRHRRRRRRSPRWSVAGGRRRPTRSGRSGDVVAQQPFPAAQQGRAGAAVPHAQQRPFKVPRDMVAASRRSWSMPTRAPRPGWVARHRFSS